MAKRKSTSRKRSSSRDSAKKGRREARAGAADQRAAKKKKSGRPVRKSKSAKSGAGTKRRTSDRPIQKKKPGYVSAKGKGAKAVAGRTEKTRIVPMPSGLAVQRLQKLLATCGFGSRRDCETLIEEGRVTVDGEVVTKMGSKVDPQEQVVKVDGQKVKIPRFKYFMLNKPTGVVSTSSDPSGRARVIDLIKTDMRVYNVGRLDKSSEGLILVTNDGELANRLTHPRYGIHKTYHVLVEGQPTPTKLRTLEEGIYLADGKAAVANIRIRKRQKDTCWLEIVLDEGRNREIRRLLASVGHKVRRLKRVGIGSLQLGELPTGAHRELIDAELKELRRLCERESIGRRRRKPSRPSHPTKKRAYSAKTSRTGSATAATAGKRSYGKAGAKSSTRRSASSSRSAGPGRPGASSSSRPASARSSSSRSSAKPGKRPARGASSAGAKKKPFKWPTKKKS